MFTLRKCRVLAGAVIALCLGACVESKHPLSDPDRSLPDAKLTGVWVQKTNDGTTVMVIGKAGETTHRKDVPAGIMRSTRSSLNEQGVVGGPQQWTFFVTSVKGGTYMNRFDESALDTTKHKTWDKSVIETYTLLKYRVSGDKLEIWSGSSNSVAKAVESGKVVGEVKRSKENPKEVTSAKLTDTTENLARYINGGGGAVLFPGEPDEVYTRMKAP